MPVHHTTFVLLLVGVAGAFLRVVERVAVARVAALLLLRKDQVVYVCVVVAILVILGERWVAARMVLQGGAVLAGITGRILVVHIVRAMADHASRRHHLGSQMVGERLDVGAGAGTHGACDLAEARRGGR